MSQISLDQAAVYTKLVELDELKKLVEEQRKTIDSLKERVLFQDGVVVGRKKRGKP